MYRVLISGLVALGFVSSLSAAANARGGFAMGGGFARGGLAMGRPGILPGGFRGVAPRPIAPRGLTRRPLLRFHPAVPILALHRTPLPHVRRFFGHDLPANGIGVSYGTYGLGDAAAYSVPPIGPTVTSSSESPASFPRGCGTQTVIVPAEAARRASG
jgi:hypothetical protein